MISHETSLASAEVNGDSVNAIDMDDGEILVARDMMGTAFMLHMT
jgi:hypothetical protein